MRRIVPFSAFSIFLMHCLFGCGSYPYSAAYLERFDDVERQERRVLTAGEQADAVAAFADAAAGQQATAPPRAAASGLRWSDLERAVLYACGDSDLMIVSSEPTESGCIFTLKSAEDYPGTLTVLRRAEPVVYEAHAVIGRFGDRRIHAANLLAELDRYMHKFAVKPGFDVWEDGRPDRPSP
jgi:hypothetical protein